MSATRRTCCCCVQRRVKDETFRPERRIPRNYAKAFSLSIGKSVISSSARNDCYQSRRHKHPQTPCINFELHGAVPEKFTIEFHRNVFFAADAQTPGLKIFNFRQCDVRGENHVLEILDD